MSSSTVELRAIEVFADLLFELDEESPVGDFYGRLCEATCRLTGMKRAVIFLWDGALRRVRAVGAHGIALEQLANVNVLAERAPIALKALSEDRVVEASGEEIRRAFPEEYQELVQGRRVICTPMAAAGRWPGVIFSEPEADRPLADNERYLLWTLGKVAALVASARMATREHERARALQERIDLAREIHDRVIQRLFGISMALTADLGREGRERCAAEIQVALSDLRSVVQRPLGRAARETEATLVSEIDRLAREHPWVQVDRGDVVVPEHAEALAQSVLAEALRNAEKHAKPSQVDVRLARRNGALVLEIVNDGVRVARQPAGMGLRLAAFEALQQGGVLEFGPTEDGRWKVRLLVPVEPEG